MTITDVQTILESILETTKTHVAKKKRDEILNERFFHHAFSWHLGKEYEKQTGKSLFESLILIPECPTGKKFRWKSVDGRNADATRANAIDQGKRGHLDFVVMAKTPICIEWKGPDLYDLGDATEVFLKLLTQPADHLKVFAAIITSSVSGKRRHEPTLKRNLNAALRFAMEVLRVVSISDRNLHAFVASVPDHCVQTIHWGQLTDNDLQTEVS